MKIRLGYACICNGINKTSSSPYTYTEYLEKKNLDKLDKVIISNLEALENIIDYNIKNNIHFYRMSSKIIPLATKEEIEFNYKEKYQSLYKTIGNKINKSNMRVDFHPDQFCVLNSTHKEVVENSFKILNYHYNLLKLLNIKNKLLVLHIGSNVLGKNNSTKRFINNFKKLPQEIQEIIAIENDDKIFNIEDIINISKKLKIPIVFDYHHYKCNKSKINYQEIFNSWKNQKPKIHFSSPKNHKNFRSHSEYINSDDFINFLEEIKIYNKDIDIMIEAKAKDDALFRLIREIKYKTNYKFIDDTTFEI